MNSRQSFIIEEQIYDRGEIKWFETFKFPVINDEGIVIGTTGCARDITERKSDEVRYRHLFDNINIGVAVYEAVSDGQDFIFKDFNRAAERIDNDKKENIVGKSVFDTRPGIEKFGLVDVFRRVWKTGEPEHHPVAMHEDDKLSAWYENFVYKLPSGEIVAVFENITERKMAEEAIIRAKAKAELSEFKYRSLIESSSDAIFCVNEKGEYQFTNKLFAETLGKTPDYFIGKSFWDVYPKEHADHRFETIKRVFETGISESIEVTVPLPDGDLYFYATANPIKNDDGRVVMVLTHAVDITARKITELALKKSEEQQKALIQGMPLAVVVHAPDTSIII
jgi:PAS domain S-box-containing protein